MARTTDFQFAIKGSRFCVTRPRLADAAEGVGNFLAQGLTAALSEPRVAQTLAGTGSTPLMLSGEPLRSYVEREVNRWRTIVERSGAKAG